MDDTVWRVLADASAAVAAAPAWQLSDDQIVATLQAERVAEAQRVAARLALLRELDVRGHASRQGATSTKAWLANELLMNRSTATADVRVARELDPLGDVPPAPGALVPRQRAGEVGRRPGAPGRQRRRVGLRRDVDAPGRHDHPGDVAVPAR